MKPVIFLLIASSLCLADEKEDEIKTVVAVQKEKEKEKAKEKLKRDKEAFGNLEQAKKIALFGGKPLLVRCGDFDCSATCGQMHEFVLCHLVDEKPSRLKLLIFNAKDANWYYHEWTDKVPSRYEVMETTRSLQSRLGVKQTQPRINWEF